ncbi:MAG: transcriptional regulator NrdR [Spirochaetales bacterium]|uniref:Transcriptional repressor NrdR n=1 Tax=Treponema berlinense TaxID=225004 RepID=A0A1T4KCN2_9SPIR|nr:MULTISPECIES: transcriptional regulator NrdR [Treponema]MDO5767623.1 transcriptional regulator NrdR [Spirochaetales bacterium]MBQ9103264.1 transcriptional repressor NrdR [Treponema sp.]MCI5541547.1 transcriptional regulator NrdR [Treponema berlinense]MDD5834107.1 transcriptional regulator NrdR [Treponema berlinense]MDY3707764.1 transcriptional regulator NrdR [Treponema berlinense]
MRCPYCGSLDDKVIESRTMANGESLRRRRECVSCGYRFTSYERIEEKPFMVIKRDGRRQPFDRTKLEKGIDRALEKRPVATSMIENIINDIEDRAIIAGKANREISTAELGEFVLERLYDIDKVAYIRFASVYKHFENLEEFVTEVNNLSKKNREKKNKTETTAEGE